MTIKIEQTEINLVDLAKSAMLERGFLVDFSKDVDNELKAINEKTIQAESGQIQDMRDKLWFSIDNDDSKDLDQLTFIEPIENDKMKVYVAIADVSLTVKQDSSINTHAEHNTTSVYTPAVIFSMLPEVLSTNLTSLNPGKDRLSFVTEMVIDSQGVMLEYKIYKAIVKNHAQLTYNAVGAWLEGQKDPPDLVAQSKELENQLKMHDKTAQTMKSYRQSKGSLSLETIEVKAIIQNRMVVDIVEEKKNRAKEIIENFMISANTAATNFLHAHQFPAFKRVVRVPKRWDKIVEIAAHLGFSLPIDPDSKSLENFLIEEKQKNPLTFPDLSLSIVKLLGRGEYVVEYPGDAILGHFGLALHNYSHSTAPNRRFPDLITQRLIRAVIEGNPSPYARQDLNKLAEHCTLKEADADKVTRQAQKTVAATLLSQKLGQIFDGIITGKNVNGTWVRIFTPPVDGKIIQGEEKVDVADKVRVKLVSVDIKKGFIDFALVL